jgi:hypothetical protein
VAYEDVIRKLKDSTTSKVVRAKLIEKTAEYQHQLMSVLDKADFMVGEDLGLKIFVLALTIAHQLALAENVHEAWQVTEREILRMALLFEAEILKNMEGDEDNG